MSECVSRRVYTVQAVALPMCRRHCGRRNGTTSRQSPVSRQPSNTSLCVCCSPRRTQLVASCVRYINCYNYYVRCCYYFFIIPFTFSKKCPFLFSRVSLTPLHFSSRQCAPVQLYTTFFMGLVKKMEWLKWIRKYSTGILDTKTGSMETLIDSASSKTINYAYTSSVIADDEFISAAAPPHQRPMLPPPPPSSQASPSPPQQPSDVYDCCVSLDGIPIKHEFQYTFSDTDGHGKITKHDVEGLATKILESMYGTTLKFSSRGKRTVKVTLNIRQSMAVVVDGTTTGTPYRGHQSSRERKTKSSAEKHRSRTDAAEYGVFDDATLLEQSEYPSIYDGVKGSWLPHHRSAKLGAQRYRREQLIEMVQRSLAENLSFQNQRKSNKPAEVVYHRPRTKRRQTGALPAKVAWSPYDFEPVAHIPSHHHQHHHQQHRQYEHLKNVRSHQQQLYSNGVAAEEHAVKYSSGGHSRHHHRATAVVSGSNLQQSKDSAAAATTTAAATTAAQEQTKNIDHQRYKRAKLASKKIHHHIHEHHHYHHYDYYIV